MWGNGLRQEGRDSCLRQGVHRCGGFGERSVRTEADGGMHGGDGCRTPIGR